MNYFRIVNSTNLKEVGSFPQRREMLGNLPIDDPKHLLKQPRFTYLSEDIFIPSFHLHPKAKLTDSISFPIDTDWIVSSKIRQILERLSIHDIQFLPLTLYKKNTRYDYFLLRPLATHEECIDFLQSELLLEDVTIPDVKEKLLVETFEEFVAIENVVHYPKFLLINYVRIQNDCPLHFFVLKNAYGLPTYFISEHLRNIFDEEKISGIRFMELDEQL